MPNDLLQSLLDALHSLDARLASHDHGTRNQLAVVRALVHEVAHRPAPSPYGQALAAQVADELTRLGRLLQADER